MANPDNPFGFKAIKHKLGVGLNASLSSYSVLATYGTALFIGDPVIRVAGGSNAAAVTAGIVRHPIASLPEIERAAGTDGTYVTGIIAGFEPDPDALGLRQHRLASTARVVHVIDDPFVVYKIQDDGAAALGATAVGLNALFILTTAGNAVTGISGAELDSNATAPSADASNPLRIVAKYEDGINVVGANCIWEVMLNQHTEIPNVLGI